MVLPGRHNFKLAFTHDLKVTAAAMWQTHLFVWLLQLGLI